MKKFIALFAVFVLCFNLTYTQPVRADTFSIPFSAVPDLINAFYTIAAGGKIEFSALIGDMTSIDDFWQNLQEYYDTHYTQPLLQSTQGLVDIGLSGLALEGVSSIDSINNLSVPITPQDIANFMGYDVNWADRYNDIEEIVVNPDSNYQLYIDCINGSINYGSYHAYVPVIRDYTYRNNSDSRFMHGTLENRTIYSYPVSSQAHFVTVDGNQYKTAVAVGTNVIDIRINGSDSSGWTIADTQRNLDNTLFEYVYNNPRTTSLAVINYNTGWFDTLNGVFYSTASWLDSVFSTTYNSLSAALDAVVQNFRNINLYVNGVLWSYVGDIQNPAISLNDSTTVGNTGNITYDVYTLNSTGDIGLDLAKWGEYIYNQCISGDGILTMDTVIDDGWTIVDTDDGERAITSDDEEDVAKVIHGFVGTTNITPTPTPDIGDPPVLKIIPPILELPDEIWPDGGRDTTVLAQIIHSTDVIMPNDIMTILWSILGILVIGGLLTILHK